MKLLAKIQGLDKRHEKCGFGNYEVSENNIAQYEKCKNWDKKTSMMLTGNCGTGKTHLAVAMLKNMNMIEISKKDAENQLKEWQYQLREKEYYKFSEEFVQKLQQMINEEIYKYRAAQCLYVSTVKLFIELNEAVNGGGKLKLLDNYVNDDFDCILLDDLGSEKLSDAKRENLYYIIDGRYRNMLPTIITSNYTIEELDKTEPRITSRLSEMGEILEFNGEDYRLKNK